jgi:hypothetical protein
MEESFQIIMEDCWIMDRFQTMLYDTTAWRCPNE